MGYKAGIGTASRVIDGLGTIGVLLLCNFGGRDQLRIAGVPVGRLLGDDVATAPTLDTGGSCLGVVMTDLPLDARQLQRVARRVGMGLARMGSVAHHGSGDIFCAVSTTNRQPRGASGRVSVELVADGSMNDIFPAVVDAAEEAVCQRPVRRRHRRRRRRQHRSPASPSTRSWRDSASPRLRAASDDDRAGLLAEVLLQVVRAAAGLAGGAGALPAAERLHAGPGAGRGAGRPVDVHDAGLDAVEEAVDLGSVGREQTGRRARTARRWPARAPRRVTRRNGPR